METHTTSFDLNCAIQRWREAVNQPVLRPDNLDELEAHLRDSVATLQVRGLTDAEAFLIAVRRAGSSAALGVEYGKINTSTVWLDRVWWILVGNLVFWTVNGVMSSMGSILLFGFRDFSFLGNGSMGQVYWCLVSAFVQLLMFAAALGICWRLFTRNWRTARAWLAKFSQTSAGFTTVATLGLLAILSTRTIQLLNSGLQAKVMGLGHVPFRMGQVYGNLTASLVESSLFVLLTLWLARRRLLAKN